MTDSHRLPALIAAAHRAARSRRSAHRRRAAQAEEQLAPSVVAGLSKAIADRPVPGDYAQPAATCARGSTRCRAGSRCGCPDARERASSSTTVHYEASAPASIRSSCSPSSRYESGFRKYAVSVADARGYMQVMPFWVRLIGAPDQNLFNLRTNLRYGCTILRHYLDRESGDLYRALGRYNGSLGQPAVPERRRRRLDPALALRRAADRARRRARRHADAVSAAPPPRRHATGAASRPRPPAPCTSAR